MQTYVMTVTAEQFDGTEESAARIAKWAGADAVWLARDARGPYLGIRASDRYGEPGDWIVLHTDGVLRPYKPAVFENMYKPAA
jgi:hypothetical protein